MTAPPVMMRTLTLVSRVRSPSHNSAALAVAGFVAPPRNSATIPSSSRLASNGDRARIHATDFGLGTLVNGRAASGRFPARHRRRGAARHIGRDAALLAHGSAQQRRVDAIAETG